MRYTKEILIASLLMITSSLGAQCVEDYIGVTGTLNPFFGRGLFDCVGSSNFYESEFKKDKIGYSTGEGHFNSIVYINPKYNEGVIASLGFVRTRLDWDDNPKFDKKIYDSVSFCLIGFSNR